ncbi:MAG: hypothetical protein KGM24_01940 [Elusimicrobia bacterium]|nr:hypothetical protein [Elusimicrobiota bacterium]
MNRKWLFAAAAVLMAAPLLAPNARAMSEKEKALASPYPNDLGPDSLPESVLKTYPAEAQEGYKFLRKRCAECHTAARPLNSRFVEPSGGISDAKQEAALAVMKKDQPELFKNPQVWEVSTKIWNRYVKRMMNKPGANIPPKEAKAIWEFLEYDGVARKTGKNAASWKEHREKLVKEFAAKYPKRYAELKAANDL